MRAGVSLALIAVAASLLAQVAARTCSSVSECDDGKLCTYDECDGGKCVNLMTACMVSGCEVTGCVPGEPGKCVNEARVCDDGDKCTLDSCSNGSGCSYERKDCSDNRTCTTNWCDANTGLCVSEECSGHGHCDDDEDYCHCSKGYAGSMCQYDTVADACDSQGYHFADPNDTLFELPLPQPNSPGDYILNQGNPIVDSLGNPIQNGCNGNEAQWFNPDKGYWMQLPRPHFFYASHTNRVLVSTIQQHEAFWLNRLDGNQIRLWTQCNNENIKRCLQFSVVQNGADNTGGSGDDDEDGGDGGSGGGSGGSGGLGCAVDYRITNDWGSGFTTDINLRTNWETDSWELTFSFNSNQVPVNVWNAVYHRSGQDITLNSMSYNGHLSASSGPVNLGFQASYSSGPNSIPRNFELNGVPCALGTDPNASSARAAASSSSFSPAVSQSIKPAQALAVLAGASALMALAGVLKAFIKPTAVAGHSSSTRRRHSSTGQRSPA